MQKKTGRHHVRPAFTPEPIRTADLSLRRRLLYPAELPGQGEGIVDDTAAQNQAKKIAPEQQHFLGAFLALPKTALSAPIPRVSALRAYTLRDFRFYRLRAHGQSREQMSSPICSFLFCFVLLSIINCLQDKFLYFPGILDGDSHIFTGNSQFVWVTGCYSIRGQNIHLRRQCRKTRVLFYAHFQKLLEIVSLRRFNIMKEQKSF